MPRISLQQHARTKITVPAEYDPVIRGIGVRPERKDPIAYGCCTGLGKRPGSVPLCSVKLGAVKGIVKIKNSSCIIYVTWWSHINRLCGKPHFIAATGVWEIIHITKACNSTAERVLGIQSGSKWKNDSQFCEIYPIRCCCTGSLPG